MRRILLLLCASVALLCSAQGVPYWLETTHDFGTFRDDLKEVTCVMKVVNKGDAPLIISRVQVTCGCTVAEYTPDVMQPGDTGSVTITYSTRDIPGKFVKNVYVYTNGKPKKSELTVMGSVIGSPATMAKRFPVAVGPLRLDSSNMPFGEVIKGESRSAYFSGYNTSSDTMLMKAETPSRCTSAHIIPDTIPPGEIFIVSVYHTTGGAPQYGLNTDSLKVMATPLGGGETAERTLYVMANVKEDFSKLTDKQRRNAPVVDVSTDKVDFETVAPNDPVERTFTITNHGQDPLRIRRLFIPEGEHLTAKIDNEVVKKGKTATVTVTLDSPAAHDSVVNTQLTVITNDPYTPITEVRVVGIVK